MSRLLGALHGSLEALEAEGIPHAISGSLAAAHHGYIRATEDVDIQVAIESPTELQAAAGRLADGVQRIDARTWSFAREVTVELYEVRDRLDEEAMAHRVEGPLPGDEETTTSFVGLEELMVLKLREHVRHGHGLKHVADVQQLLARNHDRLDGERLDELLALDPEWRGTWDELVETP
jgi:hypothetical protein